VLIPFRWKGFESANDADVSARVRAGERGGLNRSLRTGFNFSTPDNVIRWGGEGGMSADPVSSFSGVYTRGIEADVLCVEMWHGR